MARQLTVRCEVEEEGRFSTLRENLSAKSFCRESSTSSKTVPHPQYLDFPWTSQYFGVSLFGWWNVPLTQFFDGWKRLFVWDEPNSDTTSVVLESFKPHPGTIKIQEQHSSDKLKCMHYSMHLQEHVSMWACTHAQCSKVAPEDDCLHMICIPTKDVQTCVHTCTC